MGEDSRCPCMFLLRRAPLGTQLFRDGRRYGFGSRQGGGAFVSVIMYIPGEFAAACPRFEYVAIINLLASSVLERPLG